MRRLAATAIDYTFVAAWAAALLGVIHLAGWREPATRLPAWIGWLIGFATLTAPATIALAAAESHGGSPGKRLWGLRLVRTGADSPPFHCAAIRTAGKVAVPWELAHAGIWLSTAGQSVAAGAAISASYAIAAVAALQVVGSHRAWYDRWGGTEVRRAACRHR